MIEVQNNRKMYCDIGQADKMFWSTHSELSREWHQQDGRIGVPSSHPLTELLILTITHRWKYLSENQWVQWRGPKSVLKEDKQTRMDALKRVRRSALLYFCHFSPKAAQLSSEPDSVGLWLLFLRKVRVLRGMDTDLVHIHKIFFSFKKLRKSCYLGQHG